MSVDLKKSNMQMMQQCIRGIHPLCWLVLLFLASGWATNLYRIITYSPPRGETSDSGRLLTILLIGSILVVVHLGIYEVAFRLKLNRGIQWLLLSGQAVLVLALTQITQSSQVAVVFSLALFVAFIEILKRPALILLASGGYLVLLLLYTQTPGVHWVWVSFWQGTDAVYELLELLALAGLLLYLQQQRAHKRTQALLGELHAAHEQLSTYALRVEELTMLAERQRLARELHDTLTQGIVGLIMQLEAVSSYFGKNQPARAREIVLSATTRARTVLTETRYVLQDLRADNPRPDDLPEMVQEEIERFTTSTSIACDAEIDALAYTPETYCGHVLRAITEGLSNVARHAQARHVSVRAVSHEQRLEIEVWDDGVGFDPDAAAIRPGHYGLVGLRERVNLIGGELAIKSLPGQGTSIRLCVPTGEARSCA